ncbi:MAG: putative bifunctional diguanylate cyclase/phosphodiesterase [Mycobacterium leprae]
MAQRVRALLGRRLHWSTGLVLANTLCAAVALVWGIFRWGSADLLAAVSPAFWLLPELSAIALAWRIAAGKDLAPAVRRAWGLIGVALSLTAIGSGFVTYEAAAGSVSVFSWNDILALPAFGFMLAGLLSFPATTGTLRERILLGLDSLIVCSTGAVLVWYFVVGDLPQTPEGLWAALVSLAYPVTDLALFTAAVSAFLRSDGRARRPARLLALSALALTVADLCWRYLILHGGYRPGGWPDRFWLISELCVLWAANAQLQNAGSATTTPAASSPKPVHLTVTWVATLAGSFIPPFLFSLPSHMRSVDLVEDVLLGVDSLVTALIGVRYLLTAYYNQQLLTENAARRHEARFHALVQNSKDLITLVAPDRTVTYQSPSHERLFGFKAANEGRTIDGFVHPDDRRTFVSALETAVRLPPGGTLKGKWRVHRVDGSWRQTETIVTNLLGQPEIDGILLNTRDVTEQVELEEQLRHQAFYDSLTGLANRALFMEAVGKVLTGAHEYPSAVLMLDLDDFKNINDSLGHSAGDQLLVQVGERLRQCLDGTGIAARLGGDEFAIMLSVAGTEYAEAVAVELLGAFNHPFQLGKREIAITPSIGLVASAQAMTSPEEVIRCADVAMYRAKRQGKGSYVLYRQDMSEVSAEQLELTIALRQALARSEFILYYQPIYALETGRIRAFEALLRWQHPAWGLVSPAEFIPVAEESGLIVEIGRWTFEEACRQAKAWVKLVGPALAPVVNVNLSARQFQQGDLVEDIGMALSQAGLAPAKLQVEVTETAIMADVKAAAATLGRLKATGIQVAVDDFGTGYASLSYLKRLPLDVIKVDRSFIDGLGHNKVDTAIVELIIGLARRTGLAVTAEGVETVEQYEMLRRMGAHRAQGYYLSRPLPADAAERLLREHFAAEMTGLAQ